MTVSVRPVEATTTPEDADTLRLADSRWTTASAETAISGLLSQDPAFGILPHPARRQRAGCFRSAAETAERQDWVQLDPASRASRGWWDALLGRARRSRP